MITKVTITGADDSIAPADLLPISQEFPFVEWGILCSYNSIGLNRFPSREWLDTLTYFKKADGAELKLSCHLCGKYVNTVLLGDVASVVESLTKETWSIFDRVQINTHGKSHSISSAMFSKLHDFYPEKEIIFQYDGKNDGVLPWAETYELNHSALFDLSHGVGKLPSQWPDLLPGIKCGYAGGLSPQNLREQIERIEEKAGNTEIWIDMETHVRSDDDRLFDLEKVRECLRISSEYVSFPAQEPA